MSFMPCNMFEIILSCAYLCRSGTEGGTLPCATPDNASVRSDFFPFTTTRCCRLPSHSSIQAELLTAIGGQFRGLSFAFEASVRNFFESFREI